MTNSSDECQTTFNNNGEGQETANVDDADKKMARNSYQRKINGGVIWKENKVGIGQKTPNGDDSGWEIASDSIAGQ